jgi:hypothetical protein
MSVNINSTTGIPYSINSINGMNNYSMNDYAINPVVIAVIVMVIILYYVLFSSLASTSTTATTAESKGITFIEVLLWGVFILLVLLNGMAYIFNINIIASIKNLFSSSPTIDIVVDKENVEGDSKLTSVPGLQQKKQVFHIPYNKYDYENSKAICQAYGGRLATYKELNDSYNEGADWCGFGWTEGQMAMYPTQTEKWNTLQGIKGHEHDCGRPGINGGYIDNPNVRFGINCYGYKPTITPDEAQNMSNIPLYPKTNTEIEFDKKVDYWRSKINDIIVAPFNHNNWSVV